MSAKAAKRVSSRRDTFVRELKRARPVLGQVLEAPVRARLLN
jgi:hypothetical protein